MDLTLTSELDAINLRDQGAVSFTGVDLKVGGEGMKAFYDNIVPKVARDVLKKLGGGVRLALAQYRELAAFAQFASDLDEATRKQLERGRMVTELMKQPQYAPMSVAQMAVTLFAVNKGYFDDVEVKKALAFESALHAYMKSKHAAIVDKITTSKDLDGEAEKALAGAIEEIKKFVEEHDGNAEKKP